MLIIYVWQYSRAGGWMLLLSAGAGKVSWTAWCWWKRSCHLLFGWIREGIELISFIRPLLSFTVNNVISVNQCFALIVNRVQPCTQKCLKLYSLTRDTFRLELDKYVQGLRNSLQTPEVWEKGNVAMELPCLDYVLNYVSLHASCRTWTQRCVPTWAGGMRSPWCTFIVWCSWLRATSVSCSMPWVPSHLCSLAQYKCYKHDFFLICQALSHTHVEVRNSDDRTKADVSRWALVYPNSSSPFKWEIFSRLFSTRFIKAASLQGLSQQDTTTASLCKAISEDLHSDLIIDCSTSPPALLNAGKLGSEVYTWWGKSILYSCTASKSNSYTFSPVSNRFCDDWIQAFLNAAERCNPFLLRQILENFKLKVSHARRFWVNLS